MMLGAKVVSTVVRSGLLLFAVIALTACASSDKAKMAELGPNPATLAVKSAWTGSVGAVSFPLDIRAMGSNLYVASTDGVVAEIDGRTGGDVWRSTIKAQISAGVGSDGRYSSVVSRNNELIGLDAGREIWRQKLPAVSLTAPFVAGERVFVLAGDRSVTAFDAATGRRLWQQQRAGDSLVLQQGGVIFAVGDTLVAGLGWRLVSMNPQTGSVRWETLVANSRGTNEVERLVDLVAGVSRNGDQVCVRSFQSAVACLDAVRGTSLWNKNAVGYTGLGGDAETVFGTESDGTVVAWRRTDGDRLWSNDQLKHRVLTTPLSLGRSVVVGDSAGFVHFLSRDNGATLNRMPTDGSAVVAGPVLVGQTVVVVTRRGGIYGFRPE